MAVLGFHHVAYSSPDLERLSDFYCRLFGFERVFALDWEKGAVDIDRMMALKDTAARAVMLRTGNSFIEIFEFSSPQPARQDMNRPVNNHGITHICIAVDDAVAECARLEAAGLRLHCAPIGVGSPISGTYARDPDGNVIEILQVTGDDVPIHFDNRRLSATAEAQA